eukprot:TRINITY_DN996_c1_g1_i2.p1 TRINITY_DN996_c1_g1~~TRINITY_DN996_c1_g1_i2.p1  ORF type:complete len:214 (+),score=78.69 TRINITY_DN996_c1_g1_i2:562-1203(+)
MEYAKDVVEVAKKLSMKMESKQNNNSSDSNQQKKIKDLLMNMGISNPVTKEHAGVYYHIELAKQLSDFIYHPLKDSPGEMLTLPDVYCLFNRARGTALISPDDLFKACQNLDKLELPVRMRFFESGVIVLQTVDHSDDAFGEKVISYIDKNGPASILDIAQGFSISITLAQEQLLAAEEKEMLCRDESFQGIVYYKNFFKDYFNEQQQQQQQH